MSSKQIVLCLILTICEAYYQESDYMTQIQCGGLLTNSHGVIQTPHFPNPFPTPIRCKWILNNPHINGSISVFFTQQYTTNGLSFTEYMYYDQNFKTGERKALSVTDENITKIKWLQVSSPFLVVELSVPRIEGTQFRALGLLNMNGFNITYKIRGPERDQNRTWAVLDSKTCSMVECRLLGHCYVKSNYEEFYCSCFPGYSGNDCGIGPLCPETSSTCQNGGVCRQMGPAAVSCLCKRGYTGDFCEIETSTPECGMAECSRMCNGKIKSCECHPKESDMSLARYDTVLQMHNEPNKNNNTKHLFNQMTNYLKTSNITLEEDIQILNLSIADAGTESTKPIVSLQIRIWAPRKEAGNLRSVLARLAAKGKLGYFRFIPSPLQFDMHPALALQALSSNQRTEVWEESEFILTCMAYGSPDTVFTWYKDSVMLQFNKTRRDVWSRTVSEDALGRRMSVAIIGTATKQDSGVWSCVASDAGRARCSAIRITVMQPPKVKITPSSVTVDKGENASITCLASASGRIHGALGFSWTRGGSLLPLVPGREMWEDLYPAGSVLKLYNVQKSWEYRCIVTSTAGSAHGTAVVVSSTSWCEATTTLGVRWPRTAPSARAHTDCPRGYTGYVTRVCDALRDTHYSNDMALEWRTPDFSDCISDSLNKIYNHFIYVSYGYSTDELSSILSQYSGILRSNPSLPGIGSKPLKQTIDMLRYAESSIISQEEKKECLRSLMKIYDHLLSHEDTFLDEEKVYDLQRTIVSTTALNPSFDLFANNFLLKTSQVNSNEIKTNIDFNIKDLPGRPWVLSSLWIEGLKKDQEINATLMVVQYFDLEKNLPSLKKTSQFIHDVEMDYELISHHIQASLLHSNIDDLFATLIFTNKFNYSSGAQQFTCGFRSNQEPSTWNTKVCEVKSSDETNVVCVCHGLGSYGLMKIARSSSWSKSAWWAYTVRWSACICVASCLLVAFMSCIACLRTDAARVLLVLRAVLAISCATAVASLSHAGVLTQTWYITWSWIGVASWLLCGATLAAQPLLVQAELSGRTHTHAPIIAMLTVVVLLGILSARVSGGSPCGKVGGSVWVIRVNAILLGFLTSALAITSGHSLRQLARKLTPDRRDYITDRMRVCQHSIVMLISCCASFVSSSLYCAPIHTNMSAIVFSISSLILSVAIIICYIIRDKDVLIILRTFATSSCYINRCETSADYNVTTLSVFPKAPQTRQYRNSNNSVETSYWRAPQLESPARSIQRAQSNPDSRADIVRCVEFKDIPPLDSSPEHFVSVPKPNITPSRSLCDLIPGDDNQSRNYRKKSNPQSPILRFSEDVFTKPYVRDDCLCIKSNPDVSEIVAIPVKSCLKKTNLENVVYDHFNSPVESLAKASPIKAVENADNYLGLDVANRDQYYNNIDLNVDTMLDKISDDLDFLLNRTPETSIKTVCDV